MRYLIEPLGLLYLSHLLLYLYLPMLSSIAPSTLLWPLILSCLVFPSSTTNGTEEDTDFSRGTQGMVDDGGKEEWNSRPNGSEATGSIVYTKG